ncbi:hypothetical protein SGFS_072970 [Streptomyces graminofaciens]|uniref:non-specific serine/threonine protein kinase n=1 Tax=Streptomyces graminofaciens TaxID=68212 RepID=A0ABM7FHU6_9ACTN|nr:serine/threonine-protein kinase [Streptomyces graminofaciens]BBC36003.1 hypothetical protein SGFS_072970 [Streptomyces graminofaciens]
MSEGEHSRDGLSYDGSRDGSRDGSYSGLSGGEGLPTSRLIGNRYRLTERIGSGGMGTVWKAVDGRVEREVAVKQPRLPRDPEDPEGEARRRAAHRLYREARAAARVDHPSAVTIHDVVNEDGLPWIVMELVRGESLQDVLRRGALSPAESARIGLAVVGALHAAHSVGIVHRDVKPANVLLGPHGRVVLTDFGIAHVQGEESLTVSGEFVGSLEFVAPERMSGHGTAGPPSDLWSLGVLLYTAVEGWSPFRRPALESTLAAVLSDEPPKPERAGPLAPVVVRLLAKDPAERPEADEVAAILEAVAAGREPDEPELGAQRPAGLQQLGEDVGTVRLGGAPARPSSREDAPEAVREEPPEDLQAQLPTEPPVVRHRPTPRPPRRRSGRLLVVSAVTGALLAAGGVWFGTSLVKDDGGELVMGSGTPGDGGGDSPVATSPTPGARWVEHREKALDAVLSLPSPYERLRAQGGEDDQPRTVTYEGEDVIRVRLTLWDEAPASPMKQAKDSTDIVGNDVKSTAQYTSTSFHEQEAVLADTTHYLDGTPTRVMELIVRTDDDRMYELRVDMPKGTADEKKGTAVFKGARDRLKIPTT